MKIRDITEAPERDPNKDYSRLDREFRNRMKPRVDSIQKPDTFQTPGAPRLTGEIPQQAAKRASSGKNVTTDRSEANLWDLNDKNKEFFDDFDRQAKASIVQLGLTPQYRRVDPGQKNADGTKRYNYTIQVIINNVPVNITNNSDKIWIERLKPEQKKAIYDAMLANGFELATSFRNDDKLSFIKTGVDKYHALATAADIIESMGPDFKTPARGVGARSEIEASTEPADYYYKLARGLVDTYTTGQSWALSRGGSESSVGGFDANDPVIIVGYTEDGYKTKQDGVTPYREHAVPCDLINSMGIQICKDMEVPIAKNGRFSEVGRRTIRKATHVVMNMIQRNLMIVLCSTYEGKTILDKFNGWQTRMPEGWKEGDEPLARFTKAKLPDEYIQSKGLKPGTTGIPVYSIKDLDRIAEAG